MGRSSDTHLILDSEGVVGLQAHFLERWGALLDLSLSSQLEQIDWHNASRDDP
jgi:hypothetical protein